MLFNEKLEGFNLSFEAPVSLRNISNSSSILPDLLLEIYRDFIETPGLILDVIYHLKNSSKIGSLESLFMLQVLINLDKLGRLERVSSIIDVLPGKRLEDSG